MQIARMMGACALLASCQMQTRILEDGGNIGAEPTNLHGSNYVVKIVNKLDFGFDPDNRENRHRWTLNYISKQCPSARIVYEQSVETGDYPLAGRPSRTYFVYVAC